METRLNSTDIAYIETETRPWGSFYNLADGIYKMKIIQVNPGEQLSIQSHTKRAEKWICLEGILTVNLGETLEGLTEYHLVSNQTIDIPRGYIHQAKNNTKNAVYFFELQTGTYFGEDDIIRYSDIYGRK
jgi:mannose-6-phosphate isomerase-like protein (cupin superfamily)